MKIVLVSFLVLFFLACKNLEKERRALKPLISIKSFSRAFNKIVHKHELSIIEEKDFDLILSLANLSEVVEKQIRRTEYNWDVLYNDYTTVFNRHYVWVGPELKNHRERWIGPHFWLPRLC